jgi:cyclic pyranopterin phosphate synthase
MEKDRFLSSSEILQNEEMVRLVSAFVKLGIKSLRLTGGEPLTRQDIIDLVGTLKSINGLQDLAITTNGVYLKNLAHQLKQASLDRINISLDTLKKSRFKYITGADCFDEVWAGVEESIGAGFNPIKLNVILMKGINEDEIIDFVRLAINRHLIVRFIEFFPANRRLNKLSNCLVENTEVKERVIEYFGPIQKVSGIQGNGPAEYYAIKDSKAVIGFISNVSRDFCSECNRIRVDCAGRVSPCLFSGHICDLRPLLRNKGNETELLKKISDILMIKPRFRKKEVESCCAIEMSSIGG